MTIPRRLIAKFRTLGQRPRAELRHPCRGASSPNAPTTPPSLRNGIKDADSSLPLIALFAHARQSKPKALGRAKSLGQRASSPFRQTTEHH